SRAGLGAAAATDEAYLKAAAATLKTARWGMFCISGIATLEDIDRAADHGMSFLRIGTNVTETERAEPYIARAKRYGMYVSSNLMKSYAQNPAEFARPARRGQALGAGQRGNLDARGGTRHAR